MAERTPRIKTTVVGSYPVPDWLINNPSEQALADATRVVLHTQEQAGIDVVCDGELSRFDPNHPETNGMIEYFVKPMGGISTEISFTELTKYREQAGMQFRKRPPAVVDGPIHIFRVIAARQHDVRLQRPLHPPGSGDVIRVHMGVQHVKHAQA